LTDRLHQNLDPIEASQASRGRASYDDRPYADMVVFNDSGQWCADIRGQASTGFARPHDLPMMAAA
jgi:hypothetical protein